MDNSCRIYAARWLDHPVVITRNEYLTLMRHVALMRWSAVQTNTANKFTKDDKDYFDPESWQISESMALALNDGELIFGPDAPLMTCLKAGLEAMALDPDLLQFEPCTKEGADNVFTADSPGTECPDASGSSALKI
jgi:hypothetical protein